MKKFVLTLLLAVSAFTSWAYFDFSAVAPTGQTLYYYISTSSSDPIVGVGCPSDPFLDYWSGYNKPVGDLIIPSSVTYSGITYSVTCIHENAFNCCFGLTSVTIPESVTSIGNSAFDNCAGLTSVTFNAKNCTYMGSRIYRVFWGCPNLASLTIGDSVTRIPSLAFSGCIGLTSITIPKSVTFIGNDAFAFCSSVTAIIVDADNTHYDSRNNCNAIIETASNTLIFGCQNTTIPNSVTSIGNSAFSCCSSLTSVTIPNSVTSIGSSAFDRCSGLTSVTIPNSVTYIGNSAFTWCSSLISVTIPNSVTSILSYTFNGCSSLTSITCNATTAPTLSTDAFYLVPSSANIYIPCGSMASYQNRWPQFSNFIERLYNVSVSSADPLQGSASVSSQPTCTNSTAVITATPAPDCRFRQWSDGNTDNPRTITLTQDTALTAIFSNLYYDFSAVSPSGQTLYYKILSSHTICVTHPGPCDFEVFWGDYTQPTGDLIIPSTVSCSGTTYSVTEIGEDAFNWCTSLTSVTIPNSVTSIGSGAFSGCGSLISVTIPNSVTSIGDYAFTACTSLTSATIPNSVTSIGDYAFAGCSSLTSITIPNSVQEIGPSAFWDCSSLTSVSIPNSVTFIGDYAFLNCISLTSVSIPNSVTEIYDGTFNNCSSLTAITIPNSVTEIDYAAFAGCSSLTSITCDAATAPALGESAFSDVPSSASVYIPCGSTASYQSAWGEYFSNFIEPASYSITASAADPTQGSAAAVIQPTCTTAVITATPAPDYHFRQWNDGNTDNPRTLTLTQDTSLTAFFSARPQHDTVYIHDTTYIHDTVYVTLFLRDSTIIYGSHDTIFVHDTVRDCHEQQLFVLVNNDTLGACAGSGTYPLGSTVQIMAIPNRGQRFLCWNDGVTTNPRTITLTGNLTFTAIFFKQDD